MLTGQQFRAIVSGRRKGLTASLLRACLRLAEWPYTWAVRYRNRAYDQGKKQTCRVAAPVICVGNLTLGGTGKTPMVHYIARWLRQRGIRVGIVSRGYGSEGDQQNDEARELSAKLPDVPHVQNPDRVTASETAIDELGMQVILLDDGFQHRRLERDLDIVLIDALEPFGFEHVFPRGTLREPTSALQRAHAVVLSRADMVDATERDQIRQRVQQLAPAAAWIEVAHQPTQLASSSSFSGDVTPDPIHDPDPNDPGPNGPATKELPLEKASLDSPRMDVAMLQGRKVLAFCGLGNPNGFRNTLQQCGADVVDFRSFPDHHSFGRDDIESLLRWVTDHQPDLVICTHKDLVKVETDELAGVPLRALLVELRVIQGHDDLEELLEQTCDSVADE